MAWWRRARRTLPPDADVLLRKHVAEWQFLTADEREHLKDLTETLLATKSWEAARDFELTDAMCTVIAAQAALMVLGLDLDHFRHVRAVVVHPTTVTVTTPRAGPVAGLMDDSPMELVGEAHGRQGPVLLAWDTVRRETIHRRTGRNVVIHEFAHKLDMLDGWVDGTPPLGDESARRRWVEVCTREFRALRAGEPDPILREYAASDTGEFFAVATEAFFDRPVEMAELKPDLYGVLGAFFAQDPAARRPPVPREQAI